MEKSLAVAEANLAAAEALPTLPGLNASATQIVNVIAGQRRTPVVAVYACAALLVDCIVCEVRLDMRTALQPNERYLHSGG